MVEEADVIEGITEIEVENARSAMKLGKAPSPIGALRYVQFYYNQKNAMPI